MASSSPPPRPVVPAPLGLRVQVMPWRSERLLVLSHPVAAPDLPPELTTAEREVLLGLLAGEVHENLAKSRGTSARTVANQVGAIFRKLGVSSRAELLARIHRGISPRP